VDGKAVSKRVVEMRLHYCVCCMCSVKENKFTAYSVPFNNARSKQFQYTSTAEPG